MTSGRTSESNLDISHNILGYPVLIDIRHGILHFKWNIILHHLLQQHSGLGIGSKQHRHRMIRNPLIMVITDFTDNRRILISRSLENTDIHRFLLRPHRLDLLVKTLFVILNHASRPAYDSCLTAVIDRKENLLHIRKIFLKVQHDLRPGPPESINRLVIIPHNKNIVLRQCQHPDQLVL